YVFTGEHIYDAYHIQTWFKVSVLHVSLFFSSFIKSLEKNKILKTILHQVHMDEELYYFDLILYCILICHNEQILMELWLELVMMFYHHFIWLHSTESSHT
ncbi:hypothetical protein ACJX0J_034482, partial [Zea mays]